MAYKALYRLYRPQSFEEVVGQKYILKTLKNAINENKISHAYLFSGPRGTGKTSMAKLLAKALNCTSDTKKPCGECPNCKAVANNTYPDVIEIDAASNNGVNEVRELIDKVKYAPQEGKYKVYIIDEVHMMSTAAFNALLKTLEEPPAHVIFILATTEPNKVLPTVLSRCQRFDFGRLSTSDMKKRIEFVLKSEQIEFESGVVELIATLAEGGMRDALGILDQAIAYAGDHITLQHIRDIYGVVSSDELIDFLLNLKKQDVRKTLEASENYDLRGVDITRITNSFINVLKECIIYQSTKDASLLSMLNEAQALRLVGEFDIALSFVYIDVFTEALVNYKRVNDPKGFFELAALKLCKVGSSVSESPSVSARSVEEVPVMTKKVSTPRIDEEVVKPKSVEEFRSFIKKDAPSQPSVEPTKVEETQPSLLEGMEIERISLTDDELLNILMQNSKEEKILMDEKWELIPQYFSRQTYALIAHQLSGTSIAAYSIDAMILSCSNNLMANRLNEQDMRSKASEFLKELLGKDVAYYAVSSSKVDELRAEFKRRRDNHSLLDPYPITEIQQLFVSLPKQEKSLEETKEIHEDEGMDSESFQLAKGIFGELLKEE